MALVGGYNTVVFHLVGSWRGPHPEVARGSAIPRLSEARRSDVSCGKRAGTALRSRVVRLTAVATIQLQPKGSPATRELHPPGRDAGLSRCRGEQSMSIPGRGRARTSGRALVHAYDRIACAPIRLVFVLWSRARPSSTGSQQGYSYE